MGKTFKPEQINSGSLETEGHRPAPLNYEQIPSSGITVGKSQTSWSWILPL